MFDTEYAAARTGAIVLERTDRALLRVYGRDPVKMIQGLITNDLAGAPADRAVYAAVLTPKGKMVADVRAFRRGTDVWLEVDAAARAPLVAHLRKFVPPLFARFEDVTGVSVVGVYGPAALAHAGAVLGAGALRAGEDELAGNTWQGSDVVTIGTRGAGVEGVDLIVFGGSTQLAEALERAGAVRAGMTTLETLRVEAGVPRWGAELTEDVIPLEAGLRDRAISQTKGCYTGQETIVRILHRGHVNWHLRGVLLGDAAVPERGTQLVRAEDDKVVARVTSAARSPVLAQTVALAYVRREVPEGATLRLPDGGTEATVVALPLVAPAETAPA